MNKAFPNFTWKNSPSVDTPIGQINLNKINTALNTIDDRVILLDSTKADATDVNSCITGIEYNTSTGVFLFTWMDGATLSVDLNIEKIPVSFSMDENGVITMTCEDGTTYTCDIGAILPVYTFIDSDQLDFTETIDPDTGAHNITAIIKNGSITDEMLNTDFLAALQLSEATAEGYAESASGSATEAASYAHGNTGSRTGEAEDNAMYYSQQAANSAEEAATYAGLVVPSLYIDVVTGQLMQKDDGQGIDFYIDDDGYLKWQRAS